jgi:general secretion pathway protein G
LLELILVMVIISILAGTVVVAVSGRGTQAREIRAKSDLRVYQTAIEAYALEHNDQYPKTLSQLATPNKKGIQYVMEIKNDGWGRPYVYNFPGKKNKYDLYSLGADGQTGTADDISVWDSENARE